MHFMGIKEQLFGDLDFNKIVDNKDFKEASVREVIIAPILRDLGFTFETIIREKYFEMQIGSKKQKVLLYPDYLLRVENSYAWILEAKAPNQKISDSVDQAYSYASHKEIRSNYFAICNGIEFACYRTNDPETPLLYFRLSEIDEYWEILQNTLSPQCFQSGKTFSYEIAQTKIESTENIFDYSKCTLLKEIKVKKQSAKRHFGVNSYFTRQSWDIVAKYINNFSQKGDIILDPFGGSGVTAVEALVNDRKPISIDINPLSVFIMQALTVQVSLSKLSEAYNRVIKEYSEKEPKTKKEIKEILTQYPLPKKFISTKRIRCKNSSRAFYP